MYIDYASCKEFISKHYDLSPKAIELFTSQLMSYAKANKYSLIQLERMAKESKDHLVADCFDWLKTDDYQYLRKLKDGKYELVEGSCEDDFIWLAHPDIVDINEYIDDSGEYTSTAKNIITSYYSSVEEFKKAYPNLSVQHQMLAEMVYEVYSTLHPDYDPMSEADFTTLVCQYMIVGEFWDDSDVFGLQELSVSDKSKVPAGKYVNVALAYDKLKRVCDEYGQAYGERYGGFASKLSTLFENLPTIDVRSDMVVMAFTNKGDS